MQKINPVKLLVILLSISLAFTGALCPDDPAGPEEKKCGDEIDWGKTFTPDQYIGYSVVNGTATFEYEAGEHPIDICVNSHLSVEYNCFLNVPDLPANWIIKGSSFWLAKKREIGIFKNDDQFFQFTQYRGGESFSIKDEFGAGTKGSLALKTSFSFPSMGSLEADKKEIKATILSIGQKCAYLKYIGD